MLSFINAFKHSKAVIQKKELEIVNEFHRFSYSSLFRKGSEGTIS